MKKIIEILRKDPDSEQRYRERFDYEIVTGQETAATALRAINAREPLLDNEGKPVRPIVWECSCMQKKCGACAMVICGKPRLACDAVLSEYKQEVITLEPLRKFPCIADLAVDRSAMYEHLKEMKLWLEEDAKLSEKDHEDVYQASECLQCGLCLEVCPNFYTGGKFFGMAVVPAVTKTAAESGTETYRDVMRAYSRHVYDGCGKSLSCQNICPKKIDTEHLLVKNNGWLLWKKRK